MSDIQVKPGYKRTEVGLIPADWELMSFDELFNFLPTSSCSRSDLSDGGDVYYVHYGDIHVKWDFILDFEKEYVPRVHADKVKNAALLKDGDIIMVDASEDEEGVGKSVEVTNLGQEKAVAGLHTLALRPKTSNLADGFKAYIQSMPIVRWQIRRIASGLKVFGVSKEHLRNVQVPLPPLPEQRAIAQVLSDVDAWIEALDRLIAKKRAVKQAAMEDLLTGRVRLPGVSKRLAYKRTEVGVIPADWSVVKLGTIGTFRGGSGFPRIYQGKQAGNIPFFKVSDMNKEENNTYMGIASNYIDESTRQALGATLFPQGTIVFAKIGAAIFQERKRILAVPSCIDNNMMGFTIEKPGVDRDFIYWLLLRIQLGNLVNTTALPSLNSTMLTEIKVPLPPLTEQRAIAKVLSDMDAEIEALERQRKKAAAIKQGLMQKLLTGRIRLVQRETPTLRVIKGKRAPKRPAHSWAFNEAVVIATLANRFADIHHPLGRKRYTKLAYLLHRYADEDVGGYLPKAAGPYNPRTRYAGPEKIAIEKGYVRWHTRGPYEGFVAGKKVAEAEKYFRRWYGLKALQWLDQFRYKTNDELELLTTVDMAVEELKRVGKPITVETVKEFIRNEPEWVPKLERPLFSDDNIARAIKDLERLFDTREE